MGRKKGRIHEVGGPPSQVDPAKRKSCKRGDVQTPREATESATGGSRPVTLTGKSVDLQQSTCTSTCLRVLYSNVDSVLNKRAELSVYLQLHKPVIVALVEILPKNLRYPIDENEIALDGYTLFHNLNARGRGIALYVHCSLKVKEVHLPNQDFNVRHRTTRRTRFTVSWCSIPQSELQRGEQQTTQQTYG